MISKMGSVFIAILGITIIGLPGADLFAGELKPLIIKGDYNYPPYEYLNNDGQPEGFDVDIIRGVAKEMGLKVTIELEPWNRVREQLETGKIDALMGMFNTKERDKRVDFSIPYFIASYAVFSRDLSDINSLEDSYNKAIIVQNGDLAHDFVVENDISDKLVIEESAEEVLWALSKGKADCAIVSRLQGLMTLKKKNIRNIKPVGSPIIQRKYCIAVTEGNSNLLATLNEGLSIIKTTGEYDRIYEKWFGVYERFESKYQTIFRYFFLSIIPLVLIIILTFIWSFLLKREVRNRTCALSESEERYRSLVETMNEGMAVQKNQVITYANNSFCKMLGYTKDELIGKAVDGFFKEKDRQKFENQMKIRSKGLSESYEMELLTKDGGTVFTIVSPQSMSFDGKLFNGSSAIFTDITKRKEAEDELRNSRDRFQSLVSNIPGIIYRCRFDKDWTMLFMTDNVVDVTGYPAEDFIQNASRTFESIIHYEDAENVDRKVNEAVDADRPWEIEYRILHKNGSVRWVYEKGSCILEGSEKKQVLDGFILDITDRKEAEDELKKNQIYIANIIDSMPSILIGVDSDGLVTHWNLQAEKVTAVTSRKAVGQPLAQVIGGLAVETRQVFDSMEAEKIYFASKKALRKTNETTYEDITIYPLISKGLKGAVIRLDDVTDKVRMEEVLIQNEKMLSVGGLAAGMAHEINNPLAAMMHTSDVMENRLLDTDIPANIRAASEHGIRMETMIAYMEDRGITRMLATIRESGGRVAEIVNNMLSFARKSEVEKSLHDLNLLLDKTLKLAATDYDIKKRYDFKSVEIEKNYDSGIPPVPCEEAKIQQVLLNIFRNGAQAMQESGMTPPKFIVRTRFDQKENAAIVEVEDNGPGIDKETQKRVFEPFFTTKPAGMGTGLGLSVSYFIVHENHHGKLSVESVPGEGAKFTVSLPLEGERGDI